MVSFRELQAIYVMWLRQIKHFKRAKSRIIISIVQPLFFLLIFGAGFSRASFAGIEGSYIHFLAPGIIAMAIMFSSIFTGVSVLWDKQFGFLQEVLVAPVSRLSIIIGRTLGGATQALIQGFFILFIAIVLGVPVGGIAGLFLTIFFMVLIAFTAVGFGLIIASKINDFQSFPVIMNLVIMPLFFMSSAFFPLDQLVQRLPPGVDHIYMLNPLFYMVDGLRGSLTGIGNIFHPMLDLFIVFCICAVMMGLGSYFFKKSEV